MVRLQESKPLRQCRQDYEVLGFLLACCTSVSISECWQAEEASASFQKTERKRKSLFSLLCIGIKSMIQAAEIDAILTSLSPSLGHLQSLCCAAVILNLGKIHRAVIRPYSSESILKPLYWWAWRGLYQHRCNLQGFVSERSCSYRGGRHYLGNPNNYCISSFQYFVTSPFWTRTTPVFFHFNTLPSTHSFTRAPAAASGLTLYRTKYFNNKFINNTQRSLQTPP